MSEALIAVGIGLGAWWLYNRQSAAGAAGEDPPAPLRGQEIISTPGLAIDNPRNVTEDVQAWLREATNAGRGRGTLREVIRPRRCHFGVELVDVTPRYGGACRPKSGFRNRIVGVAGWATTEQSTRARIRPNPDAKPPEGVELIQGCNTAAIRSVLDFGLPGAWFLPRYTPAGLTQGIDPSENGVEFLPGTQGQAVIDAAQQTPARVPGFVALGALWLRVTDSRNWRWVRDAFDREAGGNIGIEYFVSHLGRCAIYTGRYRGQVRQSAPRQFFALPANEWSPVWGTEPMTANPIRQPKRVWPRTDFWYDNGAPAGHPARSPWVGCAQKAFLDLPVVEIPGIPTQSLAAALGPQTVAQVRNGLGQGWGAAQAVSYRFRCQAGRNYAQLRNDSGWPNGRFAYPGLAPEIGA